PFFGWQHGWQWQGNALDNKMLTTRGNTMSMACWRQVNGFALDAVADAGCRFEFGEGAIQPVAELLRRELREQAAG
ncbi:MAG TPA: hypothetical protein VFB55_06535, partial [Verrucomicrobiae bacterium]|nr:hypothetical protein [Verrucomicrobiae bacterium]